ncbi:hypothetical protein MMC19_004109 [Ptychographa xylographoides]|nr:hypothetical protein [Ptychographa xylographoides]
MSLLRHVSVRPFRLSRSLTTTRPLFGTEPGSTKSSDHTTNSKDELDVQSSASKSGARARAEGSTNSSATSEKDTRNDNERAQKDHPEAPMVIGMNDERGGKGH